MAIVSDVEIRLRADIARLQQDMDRARQSVSSTMSRITSVAKGAMGALAAIGGVAMFAGFIKSAIDAQDAVSDISQRTGVAIKDIAGLQLWFQKGGMEAGAFEGAMAKLSREMASNGKEFERMGVKVRDTTTGALRPNVAVLMDLADVFAKMPEGPAKTALAMERFGKSGYALLPMLNEGSEGLREMMDLADRLGLTFDDKTADAAGKFNDTLAFMGAATQGVGRQVAAQLLPTLNSLVGTMFKFATGGDGVRKAADVIATGFKGLYTVGVGLVTTFNVVAETISGTLSFIGNNLSTLFAGLKQAIEGNYTEAWRTLTSGGMRAAAIASTTFKNVKTEMSAAAATISDAWTGANGDTVAALAGMGKATNTVTEEQRKAAEKQAEAYRDLVRKVQDRVDTTARELEGLRALSEAEKFAIELTEDLNAGKVKLTKTQEAYVRALNAEAGVNAILTASNKEYDELLARLAKNAAEAAQGREAMVTAAREEAEQNEWLVKTFGMSEAAIVRLEAARLKEQTAQKLGRELNAEEITDLERVVELKNRSADAMAKREELEQVKQFWTDIDKTAHDTFVSIANGGKDLGKRLRDTLKNTFFDWLYQMTIKKWIINVQTSASGGTDLVSGITGGGGGILNSLSSMLGSGGGGGGIMNALGNSMGSGFLSSVAGGLNGAGVGSGLTSSLGLNIGNSMASALGPSMSSAISSGLSTVATALPYVAIAAAVYAIGKKAFGMGPKEYTGTATLSGQLGANGLDASMFADWKKKGGWLRSDKTGSDRQNVNAELAAGITSTYQAIKDATAQYAQALGLNADAIATRAQGISIAFTKDEAANQKAIAEFFAGVADTVALEVLPSLAQFQREGDTAAATLQRVATNFQGVNAVLEALGTDSQTMFRAVGVASLEARERLVGLAGGLDALGAQVGYFTQNFLTEAEQIAPVQRRVSAELERLGFAGLATTEQFKDAVLGLQNSGAVATEEGAKLYAGLLALAPQFKTLADYTAQLGEAAAQTALDLAALRQQSLQDNAEFLNGIADTAMAALGRAVDAQKDRVTAAYQEAMRALDANIAQVNATIERTGSLSKALRGAITAGPGGDTAMRGQVARAEITAALAIARSSGVLPSAESLAAALSTVTQDNSDDFATLQEYQRAVARTNAELEALGGLSDKELTNAERQLQTLEAQKVASERAYEAELQRLDALVSGTQAQLDAIRGVDNSVKSVDETMRLVAVAMSALRSGATPGNPNGFNGFSGAATVEDLYTKVLGRAGDAAGVAFWKKAFGDTVDQNEYLEFVKSAQAELALPKAPPMVASASGTMGGSSALSVEQQEINARLEANTARTAAAVEQLALQFNQVSAGGNALATESI